jgi:hypothetical protein
MQFKLKTSTTLLLCLASFTVLASDLQKISNQLFRTLCVGDKSTGFNWRNNDWEFARFKPEKYIIEKLKIERDTMTLLCWSEAQDKRRYETKENASDHGCYNVRKVGTEMSPARSELCIEEWKGKNGQLFLEAVSCKDVHFKPNGYFHMVGLSADLDDKSSYKDSMDINVGKCSVIQ